MKYRYYICLVALLFLTSCYKLGYEIKHDKVYFHTPAYLRINTKEVIGADAQTFKDLTKSTNSRNIGKDKNHVYYGGNIWEKADPKSFVKVGELFKDTNHVFLNYREVVTNADPKSFKHIHGGYYKDNNFVFYGSYNIEDLDVASFKYVGHDYYKDINNVYYKNVRSHIKIDPNKFDIYSQRPWAHDDKRIFWNMHTDTADVSQFKPISENWGKTNTNYYYRGKAVSITQEYVWPNEVIIYADKNESKSLPSIIDYSTFRILNENYAKDKYRIYYQGKSIRGDANSFVVTSEKAGHDKYFNYENGNKTTHR